MAKILTPYSTVLREKEDLFGKIVYFTTIIMNCIEFIHINEAKLEKWIIL